MAEQSYDNELRGVLFRNDKKEDEKHPDYRGQCQVEGIEYWVDGWINAAKKDGRKFMALRLRAKDQQPTRTAGATPVADDDIPF